MSAAPPTSACIAGSIFVADSPSLRLWHQVAFDFTGGQFSAADLGLSGRGWSLPRSCTVDWLVIYIYIYVIFGILVVEDPASFLVWLGRSAPHPKASMLVLVSAGLWKQLLVALRRISARRSHRSFI